VNAGRLTEFRQTLELDAEADIISAAAVYTISVCYNSNRVIHATSSDG